MSVLAPIDEAGIQASIEAGGGLRLRGLSHLTTEQKNRIIEYARTHKQPIMAALTQASAPGQCESCPAAGYWDYAQYVSQGLLCFHYTYYLGRPGKPKPCSEERQNCPRNPKPSERIGH